VKNRLGVVGGPGRARSTERITIQGYKHCNKDSGHKT